MNTFPDNPLRMGAPLLPRTVKGSQWGSLWGVRLFTLPHTLIGIGVSFFWFYLLLWVVFGADTPGTVIAATTSYSRKGGTSYHLNYQYQDGAVTKSASSKVGQGIYLQYQGDKNLWAKVTVHHFSIGLLNHVELRESGSLWKFPGFLTVWVLFWNTGVGVFFYHIWIKPALVRQLCRKGIAVPGKVTGKRISAGKSSSYYISYTFKNPENGNPVESEMLVWNKKLWTSATQDQQVTVFYAPGNLKRSTIYEFSGYRVE